MFRKKDTKKKDDSNQIDLVLLKAVNNNIELDILKAILDDNSIPYIVRDYGAGGHMRIIGGGAAPFRTDILVDKSTYDRAKELMEQVTFE